MAAINFLVVEGGKEKRRQSDALTPDFLSIRLGASNLPIAENSGNLDFGSIRLVSVADPVNPQDVATKAYADGIAAGLDPKASVRYATLSNIASIASANQATIEAALDTVSASAPTLVNGDRVLVKNQTNPVENGIYAFNGTNLVRAADFDGSPSNEVSGGAHTFVEAGDTYAGAGFVVVADGVVVVDTDAINFTQFSGGGQIVGGAGLLKTGNQLDIELATDPALEFDAVGVGGKLRFKADGVTLERHADGARIKDLGVSTAKLADDSVTKEKVNADVAGAGIGQNVDGSLEVNVDDVTIEIATDTVQVKDGGIGTAKIANAAVDEDKLATSVAGDGLTGGAGSALAVGAGEAIKVAADSVAVDFAIAKINDNAGAITVGQIVYVKANFNVDLARADVTDLDDAELGIVEDASIASAGSGKIIFRRGAIVGGFTGLTRGEVFVSRTTAGGYTQDISNFVAGESVYVIGRAISATQIVYDPEFRYLIG